MCTLPHSHCLSYCCCRMHCKVWREASVSLGRARRSRASPAGSQPLGHSDRRTLLPAQPQRNGNHPAATRGPSAVGDQTTVHPAFNRSEKAPRPPPTRSAQRRGQEQDSHPAWLLGTVHGMLRAALATGLAVGLACGAVPFRALAPAMAEDITLAFPASRDPELRKAQQTLVEAWGYINVYHLDSTFHGMGVAGWEQALQDALAKSFRSSPDEVYDIIDSLLGMLDDPYSRLVRPQQAPAVRASLDGRVSGLGLVAEPNAESGDVVVRFVAGGSPAAMAGIREGDLLLTVNGTPAADIAERDMSLLLANEAELVLQQQQPTDGGSAAGQAATTAGRAAYGANAAATTITLTLQPADIEVIPVQYTMLDAGPIASTTEEIEEASTSGNDVSSARGDRVAYVRITTFSLNAPQEVEEALSELVGQGGARSLVLDLRDNGGGVLDAGYDVARLLLPPGRVFCVVATRGGTEYVVAVEPSLEQQGHQREVEEEEGAQLLLQQRRVAADREEWRGQPAIVRDEGRPPMDVRDGGSLPPQQQLLQEQQLEQQQQLLVAQQAGPRAGEEQAGAAGPLDDNDDPRLALAAAVDAPTAWGVPMVVLVNGGSASTSELLAGALRDSGSALLLGERTFGKGVTQEVAPLSDGSLLFFTNTRYTTPGRERVDGIGLTPDVACSPARVERVYVQPGGGDGSLAHGLQDDPCVQMALEQLRGHLPGRQIATTKPAAAVTAAAAEEEDRRQS